MLAGQLALIAAALFTGAAFYINFAEQPARLDLDARASLLEWKRAYGRGLTMQLSLVVAGFLLGLLAWSQLDDISWLVGALAMALNIPYTLAVIAPVKRQNSMPSTWRTRRRKAAVFWRNGARYMPCAQRSGSPPCWYFCKALCRAP